MQYLVDCHQGCGDEFVVNAPDRSDPRLVERVKVACEHCSEQYRFTVDGDGEPSLDSSKGDQNIDGSHADDSTHY